MPWAVSWSSKAWVPTLSCWVLVHTGDLGRGAGSSARVPPCENLQQGKDGCHSPTLFSLWSHLVLQRAGDSRERERFKCLLESQHNFSSVLCYTSAARLLPWLSRQGAWSCNYPRAHFCLIPTSFPFVGTQSEEGLGLLPDLTPVGNWDQPRSTSGPRSSCEQLQVPWFWQSLWDLQLKRSSLERETYGNKYVGFVQRGVKMTGFDHLKI